MSVFVAVVAAVSSLAATTAPLFGPATRLSPFRTGAPGDDLAIRVEAAGNGFVGYWAHHQETRSVAITGNTPSPDPATERAVAGVPAGLQACNETHCATAYLDVNTGKFVIDIVSRTDGTSVRVEHAYLILGGIASDPGGFAVTDQSSRQFVRVDNSGQVTADVTFPQQPAPTTVAGGALAFNGSTYALFYSTGFKEIDVRTVHADGSAVSIVVAATTKVASTNMQPLRAAWNGSEYLLALVTPDLSDIRFPESVPSSDLYALRVGSDFRTLDPQPLLLSTGGGNTPAGIAANGGTFYVLWTHNHDAYILPLPHLSVIEGAAIDATGTLLTHDVLSLGLLPQENPTIGVTASAALVTWTETDMRTQIASLRYALVNRTTHATLSEGELDSAAEIDSGDVVPLGGDFLVVWRRSTSPAFGRISARAAIIRQNTARQDLTLPDWAFVHAAANADHWLVAGANVNSIQTIAIERDGQLGTTVAITPGTIVGGLASNGDRFLTTTTVFIGLLDRDGKLIALQNDNSDDADFTDGRFGALQTTASSVILSTYDQEARRLTTTSVAPPTNHPALALTHVGPWFIVSYTDAANAGYVTVVASDGTLLARDVPAPRSVIAKSDSRSSTAVLTVRDSSGSAFAEDGLFTSDVTIDASQRRRAARH
jgi:hypothetical protein